MGACNPELLSLLADGEAAQIRQREAQEHLKECRGCREALEDIHRTRRLLAGLCEVSAPPRIRSRAKAAAARACRRMRPLIGEYLDEELDSAGREALALHFALCEGCQAELALQRRLRGLVSALPEVNAPLRVRARARAKAGRRLVPGFRLPAVLQPVFAARLRTLGLAAALGSAILAFVWLLPFFTEEGSPVVRERTGRVRLVETAPDGGEKASPAPPLANSQPEHGTKIEGDMSPVMEGPGAAAAPARIERQARPSSHAPAPRRSRGRLRRAAQTAKVPTAGTKSGGASFINTAAVESLRENRAARELPTEIAQARLEMQRASERHRVLKVESVLTRLPFEEGTPQNGPGSSPAPKPEVFAPDSGSWV
jgi:anti-sigma factor RsiW